MPILICCVLVAGVFSGLVAQVGTATAASLSWSIIPSPGTGTLNGVSCTSSTFCMAVGAEIESWDGTAWTVVPSPSPSGSTSSGFYGVSCLSSTNCTAVGYSYEGTDGSATYQTLIESWDGAAWTITPSPTPGGGGYVYLLAVSCLSATNCTAVGYSANGTNAQTLIESWDGAAWTITPSPNVNGRSESVLSGVSCVNAIDCTAVGYSQNGGYYGQSLVESWDGTSWSITPSPNPAGSDGSQLLSVSCVSATNCTAAGFAFYNGSQCANFSALSCQPLIETWDRTAWSVTPTPNPTSSDYNPLEGVSCSSATDCTAVGYSYSGSTVIESWDGTAWTITPSPDVSGSNSQLFGINCPSALGCVAVGKSDSGSLVESNLSLCAAGLHPHVLSATYAKGTFTGLFCVNAKGFGTYTQGSLSGFGWVTVVKGTTAIAALGKNLFLAGSTKGTKSSFLELAPTPIKFGTFTLS